MVNKERKKNKIINIMVTVANDEVKTYWFMVNPPLLLVKEIGLTEYKFDYS